MQGVRRSLLACVIAASAMTAAPAAAADRQAGDRVVSASGTKQIDGKTAYVEVLVEVPSGQSESAAKSRALQKQNASAKSSRFATTGLVWDNATATQRYNPSGPRRSRHPIAGLPRSLG